MTSSIRTVLRKALLSLQLPAKEGLANVGMSDVTGRLKFAGCHGFAEPKNTGCLYTKMISLDYIRDYHSFFPIEIAILGMNKW